MLQKLTSYTVIDNVNRQILFRRIILKKQMAESNEVEHVVDTNIILKYSQHYKTSKLFKNRLAMTASFVTFQAFLLISFLFILVLHIWIKFVKTKSNILKETIKDFLFLNWYNLIFFSLTIKREILGAFLIKGIYLQNIKNSPLLWKKDFLPPNINSTILNP